MNLGGGDQVHYFLLSVEPPFSLKGPTQSLYVEVCLIWSCPGSTHFLELGREVLKNRYTIFTTISLLFLARRRALSPPSPQVTPTLIGTQILDERVSDAEMLSLRRRSKDCLHEEGFRCADPGPTSQVEEFHFPLSLSHSFSPFACNFRNYVLGCFAAPSEIAVEPPAPTDEFRWLPVRLCRLRPPSGE